MEPKPKTRSSSIRRKLTKDPSDTSPTDAVTCIIDNLRHVAISDTCPKDVFYIFFLAEQDENCIPLLNDLKQLGTEYEEVSGITFISRDDVLALSSSETLETFPSNLKPYLTVLDSIEKVTPNLEAEFIKLKILHVMQQRYVKEIERNDKERKLETLLNTLTKECRKKKAAAGKKDEVDDKTKTDKTAKKKETEPSGDEDFKPIPLQKNNISYDQNIFDYIWFFCLTGFYNADVIQLLVENLAVPVTGIVKISHSNVISDDKFKEFWQQIENMFFHSTSKYKSLESTVLMQFCPSDQHNKLNALQEFVFTLRQMVNIKLTHLKYLSDMTIISDTEFTYTIVIADFLREYNKTLRRLPVECVNSDIILHAASREASMAIDDQTSDFNLKSMMFSRSSLKMHCLNPINDFHAFSMTKSSERVVAKTMDKSFVIHVNDHLTKLVKSYPVVGVNIADMNRRMMRGSSIFLDIFNGVHGDDDHIVHLHDRNPSMETIGSSASLDHFMYLFLFTSFMNEGVCHVEPIPNMFERCLIQFNNCPEGLTEDGNNMYDTPFMEFRWKENMSKDVLLQEIYQASQEFIYVDKRYSPDTQNYLLVFSNKLDSFGMNIQCFNEVVRTPICIRDFCRYAWSLEPNWLAENDNRLNRKSVEALTEGCLGARKVRQNMAVYKDYWYLLDDSINSKETNVSVTVTVDKDEESFQNEFPDVLKNLKYSMVNFNPADVCYESVDKDKLLSFDLGSNVFKVSGKVITFQSHDNVKVTVDNTRIFQHPMKCTFTVEANEASVTVHTAETSMDQYPVKVTLNDGTRVCFTVTSTRHETTDTVVEEEIEVLLQNVVGSDSEESLELGSKFVECIDIDTMKQILDGSLIDVKTDVDDLVEQMLLAKDTGAKIYKVNATTEYVKRKHPNAQVPVESVLRDLLPGESFFQHKPKTYERYTKIFTADHNDYADWKSDLDFRICLPNGLYIRTHADVIHKKNVMIKQEYLEDKPEIAAIQYEEFRLFSNQGLVLIKKVDASIVIINAAGDIITFEKPNDGSMQDSVNPCLCVTVDDYRKKLNKLMKHLDNPDFTASRRACLSSKINYIADADLLSMLKEFDIPYDKKYILRFDGRRIKIQYDKITQKQQQYLTYTTDFLTTEVTFDRTDDFKCRFGKDFSKTCTFPDGTVITMRLEIQKQLIAGFTYVKEVFEFYHTAYANVAFAVDKNLKLELCNGFVLEESSDKSEFTAKLDADVGLRLSKSKVLFEKHCRDCRGLFTCDFNIEPCYNIWDTFMLVEDSYGKHFSSDYQGNWSRNNDYCSGELNTFNCNHFRKTNYKKLFVVNKDLCGEQFHARHFVDNLVKDYETRPNGFVETYNDASDETIKVVDCREKVFKPFKDRFLNQCDLKTEVYRTFRKFSKMFKTSEEMYEHVQHLQGARRSQIAEQFPCNKVFKNIDLVVDFFEDLFKQNDEERRHREELERKRLAECRCTRQYNTMEEKMALWKAACDKYRVKIRNKDFPLYFESEFCRVKE